MSARVVMTSTVIPLAADAAEAFAGLDVDFSAVDAHSPEELVRVTRGAAAVITLGEPFTREVIEQLDGCRSITPFGIGVDNVRVAAATGRGVWVTNVPDANYREVAGHTIALALSLSRRIGVQNRAMHETGRAPLALARGTRRPDEQTFGLVGLGRIGRRVATMAKAIGYRVIAADPLASPAAARESGAELVSFDEVVERSDILSLHVPLTDETRGFVDAAVLARMPVGAILVNVFRGGLVDEPALALALREGRLAGAGIDATSVSPAPIPDGHPPRGLDQVLLTPHSAHYSEESFAEIKAKALADVARVVRGERPVYPMNELMA
ncbi:C-terminal binding protein [Amycolatopsis sp. NPDC004368]